MSYTDMTDGELAAVLIAVTDEMDRRRAAQAIPQRLAECALEAQRVGYPLDNLPAVLTGKIAEVRDKTKPTIPPIPLIPPIPGIPDIGGLIKPPAPTTKPN